MKLHIERVLTDLYGNSIKTSNAEDAGQATLGEICVYALTTDAQGDQTEPGNKKFHRWQLAKRIQHAIKQGDVNAIDVPVEDVEVIKKRIASTYQTKIVGPAYEAIERSED